MVDEARLLDCKALITTQKDGVKLREYSTELPILEIQIEMVIIEGQEYLEEKIQEFLKNKNSVQNDVQPAVKEDAE